MNALTEYKDIHKGQTCVIIGNGPSLDITPLDKFAEKYKTFGSNMIYRKPFTPDYYSIIDEIMLEACAEDVAYWFPKSVMFLRAEAGLYERDFRNYEPIYPIVAHGFSLDISNFIVMGGTVTYALLQIAFYMGFDTYLLVGVDHRYPKTGNMPGHRFLANEYDPDHFQPADGKPYFEAGKWFNAPELEGTSRSYTMAKELFDKAEKTILNLTPDSALDVFEKDKIENWI
jgi:hypothetical protein